jgi:hypothetical protein
MRTILSLLLLIVVQVGDSRADEFIALRMTPGLSNEAIRYIANNSEPTQGYIAPNELPEDFIRQVCGNYTNTFGALFFGTYNRTLVRAPAQARRAASMPACAKWHRSDSGDGVPVTVVVGDSLDTILLTKIGRKANQISKCSLDDEPTTRCNVTYRELVERLNRGMDLANLKPGSTVRLPFITEVTTFRFRRDGSLNAEGHIAKIKELTGFGEPDSPLIEIQMPPAISLITPVDSVGKHCMQSSKPVSTPWPYDEQLVAAVIKRTLSHAQQTFPATLTVIDTGVDDSFPVGLLRRNDSAESGSPYGIGVFRLDNIRPYRDHQPEEVRLHGTVVARIAAGFPGLQKSYPDLSNLVKLNVVNLMEPPPVSGGDYSISLGGFDKAIRWFAANGDIANISIASREELPGLLDQIKGHAQLLVVSAAGNEGTALDTSPWYPANYGGKNEEAGTQFVTVAAIDPSLIWTSFTNLSGMYVDLFAPGCDVPYDQVSSGESGTSFAAPLVSLTAALLHSFGLRSPKEIKRRLQASVDYDDGLEGLAVWSGRLNIPKAISVYDDVLELRSAHSLEFGHWTLPRDLCKDKPLPRSIKKISAKNLGGPISIRVLWSDSQQQLQEQICEPRTDKLILQGRQDPVAWEDLIDFVPRYFP